MVALVLVGHIDYRHVLEVRLTQLKEAQDAGTLFDGQVCTYGHHATRVGKRPFRRSRAYHGNPKDERDESHKEGFLANHRIISPLVDSERRDDTRPI